MATINPRTGKDGKVKGWQAIIRRKGYPTLTKTFKKKGGAEAWVRGEESTMDRGQWQSR